MIFVFYALAALLVYLSYRSFRGGLAYLAFFRSELAFAPTGYTPLATIIVPCKGLDEQFAENLNALLTQNYPSFEVIFVVDDKDDPAVKVIEEISSNGAGNAKTIVAPRATQSSQKVENLREGVLHAANDSEVFVFADSDVHPSPNWLSSLVRPLRDENIGAATGYRWFISERANLASELRSAWNASIASALGPDGRSNFCWGGSTAIRRDTFESLSVREKWEGTLSDDFALTRTLNAAGLAIHFVPAAIVPSPGGCTFSELFEFTNRQMKITRTNASRLWVLSLFGSGLFSIVMTASILVLFLFPFKSVEWAAAAAAIVLVSVFSVAKALIRIEAIGLVLPHYRRELNRQAISHSILWAITPAIFLMNSLAALFSRRIKWRGIEYEMISPTKTQVIQARQQ